MNFLESIPQLKFGILDIGGGPKVLRQRFMQQDSGGSSGNGEEHKSRQEENTPIVPQVPRPRRKRKAPTGPPPGTPHEDMGDEALNERKKGPNVAKPNPKKSLREIIEKRIGNSFPDPIEDPEGYEREKAIRDRVRKQFEEESKGRPWNPELPDTPY